MPKRSNILLVGSGGIGTIAALNLESGGLALVTAVLRSNYDTVKDRGFKIDSCDHGHLPDWRPSHILNEIPKASPESPFDYIIVTTKVLNDIPPHSSSLIAPAITASHTAIVLIQNGLNIERPYIAAFPDNVVISGVSMCGSNERSPGFIEHDYRDTLHVGAFRNPALSNEVQDAAARDFVRLYSAAGKANCEYHPNVLYSRWRKLLYNAVLNPICALTNLDVSRLRLADDQALVRTLVKPAMAEIREAALASAGVVLEPELDEFMIESDPIEIFCTPSMLVDVRKGNYTEYEALVGEAMREGQTAGVRMDVCRTLFGLMKGLQFGRKEAKGLLSVSKEGQVTVQ